MLSETETVVANSNYGSVQRAGGNDVFQSFSINRKQGALPIMNIFSETRASLK